MQQTTEKPVLKKIRIRNLRPRAINPNKMTAKEFASYKKEVKRLGQPPKPIVVRPSGDGKYEIVDGEHAWRCAKELEMTIVLCEVRALDNFDAARECYNRNRGGTENPLVLGRLFADMLAEQNLSQRALANELNVSEGTVRNKLEYVEAADVRKRYASDSADDDITNLTHQQVKNYLELPDSIRDKWLDSGGDMSAFSGYRDWPDCRLVDELRRFRLTDFLDARDDYHFEESATYLGSLCEWSAEHLVEDIQKFLPPVAEHKLPAGVLNLLPLKNLGRRCRVLIAATAWREALARAVEHGGNNAGVLAMVESAVRVALRKAGHDPADVCGPRVAETLQVVAASPAFIQEADFLTLSEQRFIAEANLDVDDDTNMRAKRLAVDRLRKQRCHAGGAKRSKQPKMTVREVLQNCLEELRGDPTGPGDLFADPHELFRVVVTSLTRTEAIKHGTIDGRPAADVLTERLDQLEWPEFFLVAPGIVHAENVEPIAAAWLSAMLDISETHAHSN